MFRVVRVAGLRGGAMVDLRVRRAPVGLRLPTVWSRCGRQPGYVNHMQPDGALQGRG
ncbi:MAG: hypothetical protein ACKOEO_20670 [Planctomycetaceae bacterium]